MTEPAKESATSRRPHVGRWSAAIWGLFLGAGLGVITLHGHVWAHGPEQFIALKTLHVNHRLVEGDIAEAGLWHVFLIGSLTTRDDFNGRYVKDCVDDQHAIDIAKTLSGPQIFTEKDKSMVWLPLSELPAADVATLDVRRELDVCNLDGYEACGGAYQVQAIACEGKTLAAESCSAGVKITAEQRRRLLNALDEAERTPKPDLTTKPDGTPAPAVIAGNGSTRTAAAAVKTRRISKIHVMIHRSANGTKPASAAPNRCVTPATSQKNVKGSAS
jgi:hypothetical protein